MKKQSVVVPYFTELTYEENNLLQHFLYTLFDEDTIEEKMTTYLNLVKGLNIFKMLFILNSQIRIDSTNYRIKDIIAYQNLLKELKKYHYYQYDILVGFSYDVTDLFYYDKKRFAVYHSKFTFIKKENDLKHDEFVFREYKAKKKFYDEINKAILKENYSFIEENKDEIWSIPEYHWIFREPEFQIRLLPTNKTS